VGGAASGGGAALLADPALLLHAGFTWVRTAEAVDDADGDGRGVEAAAGSNGGAIALKLGVNLDGEVLGEGEIEAATGGEYVGDGVKVEQGAGGIGITAIQVVDLAAAVEEVDVRAEVSEVAFQLATAEDVLLGVDMAVVDGVGSAHFDGGIETVEGFEADVAAGGDADIFAAVEASKGAGGGTECGKGEGPGGGGHGLGMNQGAGYDCKAKQREGAKSGLQSDSLMARLTRRLS
jgi:hypothetical protein